MPDMVNYLYLRLGSKAALSPFARGDSTVNGWLYQPNLDCLLFAH